jgi:hypothetical protein
MVKKSPRCAPSALGDRYTARHPPAGSLLSGQLIGPLVIGGHGSGVFSVENMFQSLLNIIPGGRSFPPRSSFFCMFFADNVVLVNENRT